jgi:AcrR family transcriptional regulator
MDRRIEKSKNAIMEALIRLMTEKDFDKITINEIAELANVNRGTIYLHFEDKFDLLDYCIKTHLDQLFKKCTIADDTSQSSPKSDMLQICNYLKQNIYFYQLLLKKRGTPAFRDQLLNRVQEMFQKQLNRRGIYQNANNEILLQFISSATVGVLEWWIINSMPSPANEMVDQLWELFEKIQVVDPFIAM